MACPREPVAAFEGLALRMADFSSGALPPSLPKFNFGIAMPTRVSTTMYCTSCYYGGGSILSSGVSGGGGSSGGGGGGGASGRGILSTGDVTRGGGAR